MSYSQIKMCMCVDMYMVAILILLCSLKHISLVRNLKILFARKHGLSYSSLSLSLFWRVSKYPLFSISWTLVHFFNTFIFMNNFCIAHASFSVIETFQKRHLQELGAFILSSLFLCLFLVQEQNIFGWLENMLLHTPVQEQQIYMECT